jgi:hypothetical protein
MTKAAILQCIEELQQAIIEGLPENWASHEIIFSTLKPAHKRR